MKDTICVAVGLVGGFFTAIFGGWDSALVRINRYSSNIMCL